ncbi:RibD family protein [Nonomuraea sediminis]|uniref:RibD family protein n=1 Tax=Nonomuraea sediminis TaxID=2835864 RepID=UPI001BDD1F79|nr:dihydrofolate reductase family protein [Nonomuraea sediminis]
MATDDEERPRVAVCLAGSLDGRIWHPDQQVLGSRRDRLVLERLRSQADLLLYGAGTARADRREIRFTYPGLRAEVPPIAVVATRADFDWENPFWSTKSRKILVLPKKAEVPPGIEVLEVDDTQDLAGVIERLGFRRVLCEGGGRLFASLARQNLVDELFYTVTPWLLGGDATPAAASGLAPHRYTLVEANVADQEIFLRYRSPNGRAWPIEEDLRP